MPAADINIV